MKPLEQPTSAPTVHAIDPLTALMPFAPVVGKYNVQGLGGILMAPSAQIMPGNTYTISVYTLCQSEAILIQAVPQETLTVAELARLTQIIASIGHVTRRECHHCRECYVHSLTRKEKLRLYSSQPQLGRFLGLTVEHTTKDAVANNP